MKGLTLKIPQGQKRATGSPVALTQAAFVSQVSARLGVASGRVAVAMEAAHQFSDEEFDLLRRLMELHKTGTAPKRLQELSIGLQEALDSLVSAHEEDPLEKVDEPISSGESLELLIKGEKEVKKERRKLLEGCISAEEAGRLVARSRQNLESLRKAKKALGLRVRNLWRYPVWQFDPEQPGGIVGGIAEVIRKLALSPFGTAFWFTQPCSILNDRRPIDALKAGKVDEVIEAAEALGYMP